MTTRGQRLYDWWSRHRLALGLLYAVVFLGRERAFRRRSVEALDLEEGDRVLELGCGPGNSLSRLRERVGETGRVVAVDYSEGMTRRAVDRVRRAGWENVDVVRADATTLGARSGEFDAVYAAMSLTAMPDVEAVLGEASTALGAGGRLAVLDARPFQALPWTLLNPLVVPLATWITNWYPDADVPGEMERQFGSVTVAAASGGSVFVAHARRDPDG